MQYNQRGQAPRGEDRKVDPEFAWELLTNEMQFETAVKVDVEVAERLFQLYKVGIEYYDEIDDPRVEFFRAKLEALKSNLKYIRFLEQRASIEQQPLNSTLRRYAMDLEITRATHTTPTPQALLESLTLDSRNVEALIDAQVHAQKAILLSRLDLRSKPHH